MLELCQKLWYKMFIIRGKIFDSIERKLGIKKDTDEHENFTNRQG